MKKRKGDNSKVINCLTHSHYVQKTCEGEDIQEKLHI